MFTYPLVASGLSAIVRSEGGACLVDAQCGMAYEACALAIETGIARAREYGIACVGVTNSNHFGSAALHLAPLGLITGRTYLTTTQLRRRGASRYVTFSPITSYWSGAKPVPFLPVSAAPSRARFALFSCPFPGLSVEKSYMWIPRGFVTYCYL
jgi:hypothetical protein